MLTYSQMTDKQRKNTISTIMENNAENAKILAWLNAGYKYYASANKYAELRQLGVKGKLYKGSKQNGLQRRRRQNRVRLPRSGSLGDGSP